MPIEKVVQSVKWNSWNIGELMLVDSSFISHIPQKHRSGLYIIKLYQERIRYKFAPENRSLLVSLKAAKVSLLKSFKELAACQHFTPKREWEMSEREAVK